ncbi:MAG: acetate kinase [Candidatus Cloacimonadales bacterium]
MKKKKVLVINCGSSSLKYEVYEMPNERSLGKGLVERIGEILGHIEQKSPAGTYDQELQISDHKRAMEIVVKALTDENLGLIKSISEISAVGHRVVHGGERYASSVLIDQDVLDAIDENSELAPLHNPANLTGINETRRILPDVQQVAVFDTAFHQTLPAASYLYGLPREFYDKYKIRRYGFHGTSHRFVASKALEMIHRVPENTNVISCHLGNGASVTAIENGKSVDTSMGFTPLEGLIMGTRCGDIDPSILPFLESKGYTPDELLNIMNKKSGLLGLSEISNDLRDLEKAAEAGNQKAIEALDAYAYRIRKYIGAYAANLVKVSALIFTGGIGQHGVKMRERICDRLQNLGIVLDHEKNRLNGNKPEIISQD